MSELAELCGCGYRRAADETPIVCTRCGRPWQRREDNVISELRMRVGDLEQRLAAVLIDSGNAEVDELYEAFAQRLKARVEAGQREYGDKSFDRPAAEILAERAEEALDLYGWAFVGVVAADRRAR